MKFLPLFLLPLVVGLALGLGLGFGLYPLIGGASILIGLFAAGIIIDFTASALKCARCGTVLTRSLLHERIHSLGWAFHRKCPRCGHDNYATPPFKKPQQEIPPLSSADQNVRPGGKWIRGYREVKQRYIQARTQLQLGEPEEAKHTVDTLPALSEKYQLKLARIDRAIRALSHRIDAALAKKAEAAAKAAEQAAKDGGDKAGGDETGDKPD